MSLRLRKDSLNAQYCNLHAPSEYDEYDSFFKIIEDTALLFQEEDGDISLQNYAPAPMFSPLMHFYDPFSKSATGHGDGDEDEDDKEECEGSGFSDDDSDFGADTGSDVCQLGLQV